VKYYKFIVSYDGTAYCGWQIQPDHPTVVSALCKSFDRVFALKPTIVGASRTDAGVHALGQVAVCRTELDLPADQLLWAWNNRLPADIKICSMQVTDDKFHPQRNVKQKTYRFHFFLDRPCPIFARYGMYIRKVPDLQKLQECMQVFVGTHDFRSFCTGDDMGDNTTRTIDSITVTYLETYKAYCIEVKGKSFLRYMIRRIVGAGLTVASKPHLSADYLKNALLEANPNQLLPTAPAQGLMLYSIDYLSKECDFHE
jgi:tRNA pseudouridine38-40 synthase